MAFFLTICCHVNTSPFLFHFFSDETARFLAKLGRKETDAGHGIPAIANNLSDEMETVSELHLQKCYYTALDFISCVVVTLDVIFFPQRLEFFCSLPSINYAFALKLLGNFATLSEFLNRYVQFS